MLGRDSFAFVGALTYFCVGLAQLGLIVPVALPQKRQLEVRVIDAQTSEPLDATTIYYTPKDGSILELKTGVEGTCRIELTNSETNSERPGPQWIWLHNPRYALERVDITRLVGANELPLIRLQRQTSHKQTVYFGSKRIVGAVVRRTEFNGEIIPEALAAKLQATTNADGEVELASGVVEVHAKGLGIQKLIAQSSRMEGIKTPPVGVLQLRGVGTVRGRVIADSPALLDGLALHFESASEEGVFGGAEGRAEVTEFAADGSFEIPEFVTGKLNFWELRESPTDYQIRRPPLDMMVVTAGRICKLNLPLERLVTATGEVHFEDGTPVAEAEVFYASPPQAAGIVKADKSGKYSLRVLPGDWDLHVSAIASLEVRSAKGKTQDKKWEQKDPLGLEQFEIPKSVDGIQLPTMTILKQRTIKGQLIDADRKPLAKHTVFAYRTFANGNRQFFASTTTDLNGKFDLQICAAADSYQYLYDHDQRGIVQDLVAKFVPLKPMDFPSTTCHEASLVEDADLIVLQSK